MVACSAASLLEGHVELEVESIDRTCLNAYVPLLITPRPIAPPDTVRLMPVWLHAARDAAREPDGRLPLELAPPPNPDDRGSTIALRQIKARDLR